MYDINLKKNSNDKLKTKRNNCDVIILYNIISQE